MYEEQFPVDSLTSTRNVLVVGTSGSGKSRMINTIGMQIPGWIKQKSFLSASSVTEEYIKKITTMTFQKEDENKRKISLQFFDTRGVGDTALGFDKHQKSWNKLVEEGVLAEVHKVLFVVDQSRISSSMIKEIAALLRYLMDNMGMKKEHFVFVLNKTDFYKEEVIKGYMESLKKLLKQSFQGSKSKQLFKDLVMVPTCFVNPDEVRDELADHAKNLNIQSKNHVLNQLLLPTATGFTPQRVQQELKQKDEKDREHSMGNCLIL